MTVLRRLVPLLLVAAALLAMIQTISGRKTTNISTPATVSKQFAVDLTTEKIDQWFAARWTSEQITPATTAAPLAILRRLSLALHGTVPSLEELREFDADDRPQKLERWTQRLLTDSRCPTYLSERLGRALVGADEGPFLAFRRDRFHAWLGEQIAADRPWDRIVTELVSGRGLPTGNPETNFITIAQIDEEIDDELLAGRSVRAFLGQRIDCAQCHDHFFDPRWKQVHFQGLAAFFSPVRFTPLGVDDGDRQFQVTDHADDTSRVVSPGVPFGSEWLPEGGSARQRFAAWLTDERNERFDRAIVNRLWGLMFGRPFHAPIDDLPDPGDPATVPLDLIARDFRDHRRSLKWLVHVIASSRPFRLDSRPNPQARQSTPDEISSEELRGQEEAWAIFPLIRLRPEQVIGAMLQAGSIKTIDRHSHLFTRARRFFGEQNFVQEYGDLGDEELSEQTGTIPQALLRMNGELARELIQPGLLSATTTIAKATVDDNALCLRTCFEVCLGRQPVAEESEVLGGWLTGTRGEQREQAVEDIFWTLFNSPEFSWNH